MKPCKICSIEKELNFFYRHKGMSDGHVSVCKECAKARAKIRHDRLTIEDPDFIAKERVRHKEKYHRLGYKELQNEWDSNKPWKNSSVYKGIRKKYKNLNRNFELHHWSYEDCNLTDIFILDIHEHKRLHKKLVMDINKKCFITIFGEVLDTKELHKEFILKLGFTIHAT